MTDPDFIAQTHEAGSATERDEWFRSIAKEFGDKGVTHARFSYHPTDEFLCLVEGWKIRPETEGDIRWQLAPAEPHQPK